MIYFQFPSLSSLSNAFHLFAEDSGRKSKKAWGTYGVLQDCDLWVKRPEFQLWLSEIKKENLEMLPSWV
jgi:hypothetical protein